MSQEGGDHGVGMPEDGVRRHLDVIKRVTGYKPPTCPWRAYREPLVREVLSVVWACDPPNLNAVLPPNTPAILVDAIGHYRMALLATYGEERKLQRLKWEEERRNAANKR